MPDQKLKQDLTILEAMIENMADYLSVDSLFYPLPNPSYPRLTMGGYWMREERLSALSFLLDAAQQSRLQEIQAKFSEISVNNPHQIRQKAGEELQARLRQWRGYLKGFEQDKDESEAYYSNDVQVRLVLDILLSKFGGTSDELAPTVAEEVATLDVRLNNIWQAGSFVWPSDWRSAYPEDDYWWLYGLPNAPVN